MKKYKCNVVSLIVLFLICSISVGYSAFTSEMSIGNVVADVRVKKDIRITDIRIVGGIIKQIVQLILMLIQFFWIMFFSIMDDYITLEVTITNIEAAEMGISVNDYPTEVIKGDSFSVTFISNIPENVVVYSGDVKLKLSNYSYINNTLTINNVSDDILIKN